eukprot:COSAG06_NODE_3200_length_5695_cov_2.524303_7_plen_250_part_00
MNDLVRRGIELNRAYQYRFCSPTRCSLQSGRLPVHVNFVNADPAVHNPADPVSGFAGIPRAMTGIAEHLKRASYQVRLDRCCYRRHPGLPRPAADPADPAAVRHGPGHVAVGRARWCCGVAGGDRTAAAGAAPASLAPSSSQRCAAARCAAARRSLVCSLNCCAAATLRRRWTVWARSSRRRASPPRTVVASEWPVWAAVAGWAVTPTRLLLPAAGGGVGEEGGAAATGAVVAAAAVIMTRPSVAPRAV